MPPCLERGGPGEFRSCRGFRSNRQHRQLEKVVFTSALFRSPRTATRTLDKPCLAHSLRRRLLAQAPPVTVHQGIINLRHLQSARISQKDAKGAGSRLRISTPSGSQTEGVENIQQLLLLRLPWAFRRPRGICITSELPDWKSFRSLFVSCLSCVVKCCLSSLLHKMSKITPHQSKNCRCIAQLVSKTLRQDSRSALQCGSQNVTDLTLACPPHWYYTSSLQSNEIQSKVRQCPRIPRLALEGLDFAADLFFPHGFAMCLLEFP